MTPHPRFDQIVSLLASRTGPVDPSLVALLESLYHSLVAPRREQVPTVCHALEELLAWLILDQPHMDSNCQVVSDFLLVENEWEMDWSYLPSDLEELVFDLARSHRVDDDGMPTEEQICPERLLERVLTFSAP